MHPLVTTNWLAARLGTPNLAVFDTTKYLPNEPKDGKTEFALAHIPGARFFDIDDIADPDTALPHMVPTAGRFAAKMAELGISNDTTMIFYDQKGLASAARGWWMMGLFGHDKAAILDGGLPKWRAESRQTEAGAPTQAAKTEFRPDLRATRLRGIGDILANVTTQSELVLDARAAGRFTGATPEPRAGMRSGHMPGAANLPYTDLLAADQTLLPQAALRACFTAAGVDGTRPLITSCGSGVTACILTLGLTLAGLPQNAVYDGSWTEWSNHPDTPMKTN